MKTAETVALEKAIRRATYKMGTFGCYEVTIGYGGKERVDYMTYDTKGIFRCYEVKVSKADFHSAAVKSFVGHYNYYVLTRELYDQVKGEIPDWVGVYIVDYCAKKAKKQDLDCQHFFRQIFLGYFSDIVQAFDTLRKNVCGDDYTSLHNPIVLSSVLPAYGMFHSIQILFL